MKLEKARARKPLLDNATCHPGTGYDSERRELTYALNCYGPWTQGSGYDGEYKVELSKLEMLRVVHEWMKILLDQERTRPNPPQDRKPDWCQGADSVCHHPACTCVIPQMRGPDRG